jgi:hypothetical protein
MGTKMVKNFETNSNSLLIDPVISDYGRLRHVL